MASNSSSFARNVVDRSQTEKRVWSESQTICFDIHDFEQCCSEKGEKIESSALTCHGREWKIEVFPRGSRGTSHPHPNPSHVSVHLKLLSSWKQQDIMYRIRAGNDDDRTQYDGYSSTPLSGCGSRNFIKRSDVLNPNLGYLFGGTFTIEIDIKIALKIIHHSIWTPFHKQRDNRRGPLLDEFEHFLETLGMSDIIVLLDDGSEFHLHRLVLASYAPGLHKFVQDETCHLSSLSLQDRIKISKMDPTVFSIILHFIYCRQLPTDETILDFGEQLLEGANRFELVSLKLYVEAKVIVLNGVNTDNAASWLLFADAHHCAQLKETAMNVYKANPAAVHASAKWKELSESLHLMTELLMYVSVGYSYGGDNADDTTTDDIEGLDVSGLRRRLDQAGLDVDGSREMLLNRLKK